MGVVSLSVTHLCCVFVALHKIIRGVVSYVYFLQLVMLSVIKIC